MYKMVPANRLGYIATFGKSRNETTKYSIFIFTFIVIALYILLLTLKHLINFVTRNTQLTMANETAEKRIENYINKCCFYQKI